MNTLQSLETACKTHDWYYNFSDDNRVWTSGQTEWNQIKNLLQKAREEGLIVQALDIYDKFTPWPGQMKHLLTPSPVINDEDKITNQFWVELIEKCSSFSELRSKNPQIRFGQALMIILNETHPNLIKAITATDSDIWELDTSNHVRFWNLKKAIVK